MSRQIQIRRGTSAEHNNFTGAIGEVTMDTTNNTLRIHDGITVGGHEVLKRNEYFSRVSNCLTEIPQDIKLELSNGKLTLKAESKIYFPNGVGTYTQYTFAADKSVTQTSNGTYLVGIGNNSKNIALRVIQNAVSGATDSKSGQTFHWWYDTTNNTINSYGSDSTTPNDKISLPIAIITVSNGAISSIDQIFNGFGYIGSTIFALPDVKGLIPNGKNNDGTLKNMAFTTNNVLTQTLTSGTFSDRKIILDTDTFAFFASANYEEYLNKLNAGLYVIAGKASSASGTITSMKIKNVIHMVDYSDFAPVQKDVDSIMSNTKTIAASSAINTIVTTSAISKNRDGYVKFGNGIIIQWGEVTATGTNRTITLPTAFSGVNYMVSLIPEAPSGSLYSLMLSDKTSSTVTVTSTGDAASYSFNWIAVGY